MTHTWHVQWDKHLHSELVQQTLSVYTVKVMLQHHGFTVNPLPLHVQGISVQHRSKHAMTMFVLQGHIPPGVRVEEIS